MKKLVLHPTSVSQWQSLVKEANTLCKQNISEQLESYLVFLLMRVTTDPNIAKKVVALDFLETANQTGKLKEVLSKDVGDNCLIYSGLFPGQAKRRRVDISYFVKIGQSAYSSLIKEQYDSECVFKELTENFVVLMDTMHCMRELGSETTAIDLLEAEQLWSQLGSEHAKKILLDATHGTLIRSNSTKH